MLELLPTNLAGQTAMTLMCWLPLIDAAIQMGLTSSISRLHSDRSRDYFLGSTAIRSFHAVQNGIVVICAAGNAGRAPVSVLNTEPWIITVGASTIDRNFPSNVKLGKSKQFKVGWVFF